MVFVIRDFSLKDTVEIVRYQSMSLFQMKRDKSNLTSFSEVSLFEIFVHFLIEIVQHAKSPHEIPRRATMTNLY